MTSRDGAGHRTDAAALEAARATERLHIARDLHDTVIQDLLAVGLQLTAGLEHESDPGRRERDATLAAQLELAVVRLRQTVGRLRWPDSGTALEEELGAILTHAAGLLGFSPSLRLAGPLEQLEASLAHHVAAVVQESLSNVARHAQATSVLVGIAVTEAGVEVVITDDGRGMGPDTTTTRGQGLRNLRSRAADCKGHLLLTTAEGDRGLRVAWYGARDAGWSDTSHRPR